MNLQFSRAPQKMEMGKVKWGGKRRGRRKSKRDRGGRKGGRERRTDTVPA